MDIRIEKIKEAEQAAAEKKQAYVLAARADTERAKAEAVVKTATAEKEAEKLMTDTSEVAAHQAEKTLEDARTAALQEADKLLAKAEINIPAAAEQIIREIFPS